jgi:hypothetical protein
VLHAGYTIVIKEGVWSLQKGLDPALVRPLTLNLPSPSYITGILSVRHDVSNVVACAERGYLLSRLPAILYSGWAHTWSTPRQIYQFTMNGLRLGTYQSLVNGGFAIDAEGQSDSGKTVLAGAMAGCLGGAVTSPLYLVSHKIDPSSACFPASLMSARPFT